MLVLSRKKGEGIQIGKDVVVRVVEIRGDKVRLGFEAPREVPIHREEIQREIDQDLKRVRENP
jgi:carbon storage regulator